MDFNINMTELTALVDSVEGKIQKLETPLSSAPASFLQRSVALMDLVRRLYLLNLFPAERIDNMYVISFSSREGALHRLTIRDDRKFIKEIINRDGTSTYRECITVEEELLEQVTAAELIRSTAKIDNIDI